MTIPTTTSAVPPIQNADKLLVASEPAKKARHRLRRAPRHIAPMEQRSTGEKVFQVFNVVVLVLFAFVCLYPFYYIFINTISSNQLSASGKILFWPREIHFTNYAEIFQIPDIWHAFLVSIERTVIGTGLTVICSAFLGFMMTQRKMRYRTFVYRFFVATMYVSAGVVPVYLLFNYIGLLDNFLVYVLPGMVSAFYIVLVKTFIESSIPETLQEAAEIDGAGTMSLFFRIMLPLMGPILATLAIFTAVGQWNSFMDTVIYVTRSDLQTLQYILYRYLTQSTALANSINAGGGSMTEISNTTQTAQSVQLTVTMVAVLPIFMVYPFMQRYFVKGITIGAVKG
ncbi:multiple sugar transport system permease protein/putative aldouronate transport system permease protein [Propionibacterium cyclohexanicum]|uniref:Multiple sugar transport system permease protein/putative aldouronate transport system permease protein n=1 Tax=Propionibacterium cyclohexanicum TaxID=64702 RepID=A0A1H9S9Q5_9ACTN|nr:carbohydrate ABC transporter permease [Propionibacterium cyclohexanicum]SER81691.1 multiple sugar transport system permease protein/putative aldouronate transport system permease protein [Propionibacterium cyclohexanicum]